MSLTDYLEGAIGAWIKGAAFPAAPAAVYAALSTTDPTEAGGLAEPAIARQAVALGAAAETGDGTREWSNTGQIVFANGTGALVHVEGVALMDAAAAGNMLASDSTLSVDVPAGQRLVFDPGQLKFRVQ